MLGTRGRPVPAGIREFDAVLRFPGSLDLWALVKDICHVISGGAGSDMWRRIGEEEEEDPCQKRMSLSIRRAVPLRKGISRGVTFKGVTNSHWEKRRGEAEKLGSLSANALSLHKLTISGNKSCAFVYGGSE